MTYPNFKVAVIDNGSIDGSQAMVRSEFPDIELIENHQNLGVSQGYNVGLKRGVEGGADWVFLLNNDIRAHPDVLTAMMNVAETDSRIGILAPKIYYDSQPETLWYSGGKINFFTGMISHRGIREKDHGQYDEVEDTEYITGCAMLIKREVVEQVGLLDDVFSPMYSEDADYSIRARRADYRLVYVPGAKLWHKVSASTGGGLTPLKTTLRVQHNFLVMKRYARWYHWITIPWCIAAITIVFLARELIKGNVKVIAALFRGFWRAIGARGSSTLTAVLSFLLLNFSL